MTGTILPPRETAVLRGVAKSAAVLIALMFIERVYAGRASSEMEIAGILQMDLRTVRRQFAGLSAAGLVSAHGADRWLLTPEGRGTLFGETLRDPHLSIEESEVLILESEVSSAQNVHQIEDRLSINYAKNADSSSSDLRGTKCADVAQILRSAAELFDAEVMVNDMILRRDPEYVLGWVAKAWNDFSRAGSTLRSPAGLVYKRLCELEPLPVMYQKNPARGLPPKFLFEIGLLSEAEANIRAEAQEERPASYLNGAFSEFLGSGDDLGQVQFDGWRGVVNALPEVKGIAFHSSERVEIDGNVMRVYLKELIGKTRVHDANALVAEIASAIYAEQVGNPMARVEFAEEVE